MTTGHLIGIWLSPGAALSPTSVGEATSKLLQLQLPVYPTEV